MPDFTIPTRPWIALLLGALNTGLAFVVGAKTADSGLPPVAVFYLACGLAVLGWVLLHIVPSKAAAKSAFLPGITTSSASSAVIDPVDLTPDSTVKDFVAKMAAAGSSSSEPPAMPPAAPEVPQA